MINQNQLHKILDYEPDTGLFKWKIRIANRIQKESFAGTLKGNGYLYIAINQKQYLAHRLAWLYVYGYFPEYGVDHINRIPTDNRICNLREVSQICNLRNTGNYSNNKSGVKGVGFDKQTSKWLSRITINQKTIKIGRYSNFDDAVCARLIVEQCLGWSGCDSNSPAYTYVKENIQKEYAL